jgi:hypothetical protein
MEHARVMADRERIDAHYAMLTELINNAPRAFLSTMEETPCFDFVNARLEKVILPTTHRSESVPIPTDRSGPP